MGSHAADVSVAGNRPEGGRTPAAAAWWCIGLTFLAAPVLADLTVPPSPDVSWLLLAAERLIQGARYGRDVLEVNPPLIVWLSAPVVLLADSLGQSPAWAYQLVVATLTGLSAAACVRLLPTGHPLSARWAPAFAAICYLLAWLPTSEYGQREHLAVILIAPWLVIAARRLDGLPVPGRFAAMLGVVAGIGISLKPFFVIPALLVEGALWGNGTTPSPRRRPEFVLGALVLTAYPLTIALVTPEYLDIVLRYWPVYRDYYPMSIGETVLRGMTRPWVAVIAVTGGILAWRRWRSGMELVLALAVAGFAAAALIQRSAWPYVWLPVLILGWGLLLVLLVRAREFSDRRRWAFARAAGVLVVMGFMGVYGIRWTIVAKEKLSWASRAHSTYALIRGGVERYARGQPVAALSPTHGDAFPAVMDGGGIWSLRLNSLWPVAASLNGLAVPGPIIRDVGFDSASPALEALQLTAADLLARPPRLLIVPAMDSTIGHPSGFSRIDFIAILSKDPAMRDFFRGYAEVGRAGVMRLLLSKEGEQPQAQAGLPSPSSRGAPANP